MEKKQKKASKKMKKLHVVAAKHLEEDIRGYKKQRKHLLSEIKEDKDLKKKLVGKNGKKKSPKKACCKNCDNGKKCSSRKKKGIKTREKK